MRKMLTSGLAVFAGVVSLPGQISPRQAHPSRAPEYRNDPRLESLQRFFQKTECPVLDYSREFLEAADRYHLDWRLLPSISYVESTGGKAALHNNLFGWDSGRAEFSSFKASIFEVGYQLANSWLYRHKTTDAILATYNPNADYGQKVTWVMRQIAPSR
jgi:hypothetical protein